MRSKKILAEFLAALVLGLGGLFASFEAAAITPEQAARQIAQLDPQAAVVLGGTDGKQLLALNEARPYVPASCVKVPLVMAAYELLGADFKFQTAFYTNKAGDLLIKGRGDPFLISEEIRLIAAALKQMGYREFNRLGLDDRLFRGVKLAGLGASDNPYDAKFASLLVNFNTINVYRGSSEPDAIVSAEPQTPTLPLMLKVGRDISCCNEPQRVNLRGQDKHRRQYVSELVRTIFAEQGISFRQSSGRHGYRLVKVNDKHQQIYVHRNSRTLAEVSGQLLLYSNNLIANALLLQLAPDAIDPLEASVARWRDYLAATLTDSADLILNEGSGLDRNNKMSAQAMYEILLQFTAYQHLLPGDGLEDSAFDVGAIYKTGTLSGVYNAAGYLTYHGELRPFVVFTANAQNNRDEIINILKSVD